ncbi:MAG: VCBS repeat-containing protein [Acidobacteriota bacterium]
MFHWFAYNSARTGFSIGFHDGAGGLRLVNTDEPTAIGGSRLAIGDFNGDGLPDLVGSSVAEAVVWINNGAGRFTPQPGSPINVTPYSFLHAGVADFNLDGKPDIALAGYAGSYLEPNPVLTVGLNTGGAFSFDIAAGLVSDHNMLDAGDFNGDRRPTSSSTLSCY